MAENNKFSEQKRRKINSLFFDSVIEEKDEENIIPEKKRKSLNTKEFVSMIIRDRKEGISFHLILF